MKVPDLLGERFGKLIVIGFEGSQKFQRSYWKCECDCGNFVTISTGQLKSGKTKSCGCLRHDKALPNGMRLFNDVYRSYKIHAEDRNLSFELTPEEFYALTQGTCKYCGATPGMIRKTKTQSFTYNGVDRYDNNKGYTKENSVTCCRVCNAAKSDRSAEEFLEWIRRVYDYNYISR